MADDKILKPKSFRIDDETAEKFKQIATTLGGNQQETLAKLIEAFEFQNGKAVLTDKKDDIETFEGYVTALTRMYMGSLEDNQNAKEIIRTEFEALLKSKDAVIQDLQGKLTATKQIQEQAVDKAKSMSDDNAALSNRITMLEQKYDNDAKNLKQMLDDKDKLNKALTDSCTDLKSKVDELQEEHQAFKEQTKKLEKAKFEYENLMKDKADLTSKLDDLEQHEKNALERVEQQHKLELEKALLELKRKHQDEIEILKAGKQAEIDQYQKKYFELLEQKQVIEKPKVQKQRKTAKPSVES